MPNLALWKSNLRANLISGKPVEPYAQKSPPPKYAIESYAQKKPSKYAIEPYAQKRPPKYAVEPYAQKKHPSTL